MAEAASCPLNDLAAAATVAEPKADRCRAWLVELAADHLEVVVVAAGLVEPKADHFAAAAGVAGVFAAYAFDEGRLWQRAWG